MKTCGFAGAILCAPASTVSEVEQCELGGRLLTHLDEKPGAP
jgi:hypothetical protein